MNFVEGNYGLQTTTSDDKTQKCENRKIEENFLKQNSSLVAEILFIIYRILFIVASNLFLPKQQAEVISSLFFVNFN